MASEIRKAEVGEAVLAKIAPDCTIWTGVALKLHSLIQEKSESEDLNFLLRENVGPYCEY